MKMKAKVDKLLVEEKSLIQNDAFEAELPPSSMVMGPKTPFVKPKNLILQTKSCSPAIRRPLLPTPQANDQSSPYKPKKKKGN